jgi:hypothetical protein
MLYRLSYSRLYYSSKYQTCYLLRYHFFPLLSGESRIRTYEVIRQQIYSLPQLATLVSPLTESLLLRNTYALYREPMKGFEPPTCRLQISCSGQLSYIGNVKELPVSDCENTLKNRFANVLKYISKTKNRIIYFKFKFFMLLSASPSAW